MVAAISADGKLLRIRRIRGRLDTQQYMAFLEEVKLSVDQGARTPRQLAHDFNPVHRSAAVQQWFRRQDVLRQAPWSRSSPDFMPLGDLFKKMINFLNATFKGPQRRRLASEDEMWEEIHAVWADFMCYDTFSGVVEAENAIRSVAEGLE